MNLIPLLLLGILVFPDTHASPIYVSTDTTAVKAITADANLECDACMFLANGLNQTVIHNPKVIALVTEDLEQICSVLPQSVQALCSAAANQTAPLILNHLGDFIATEGCTDLGVCHRGRE